MPDAWLSPALFIRQLFVMSLPEAICDTQSSVQALEILELHNRLAQSKKQDRPMDVMFDYVVVGNCYAITAIVFSHSQIVIGK
jgi:hypothetical protein